MTEVEEKLVAKQTCIAAWSFGMVALRAGQPYEGAGHLQLKAERPELFVPETGFSPLPVARGSLPRCWKCKTEFTPGSNKGAVQRYCKTECRRARENDLKKAVRLVSKRKYPTQPRTTGKNAQRNCYEHLHEVEGALALTRLLIEHLGGQIEIGPPPKVDEPLLASLSNHGALLDLAQRAWPELMELRNKAQSAVGEAGRNEVYQNEVDANMAWYERGARRAAEARRQWDAEMGPDLDSEDGKTLQNIH